MKFSLWANLFPSDKAPYYGTFVRSAYHGWQEKLGRENVRKSVISEPPRGRVRKVITYSSLYVRCIIDALFRRPTLIEIHYPYFFIPLLFLCSKRSCVLRFHGSDLEKLVASRLMFRIFNVFEFKIKCIVVPSAYYQERVRDELFYFGPILVVAPDAVSDIFYPPAKRTDFSNKTIGVVGRLEKEKNVQEVIRALSLLEDKSVNLLVVGGGPYNSELIKLVEELGVSEQVCWVGLVAREDLVHFMHKMAVFVFPSTRTAESFGLVGLEALASGVPVIVRSSLRGSREYLNNFNSITYDDSVEALRKVMENYFKMSVEERGELIDNALISARRFSFEGVVLSGIDRILKLN